MRLYVKFMTVMIAIIVIVSPSSASAQTETTEAAAPPVAETLASATTEPPVPTTTMSSSTVPELPVTTTIVVTTTLPVVEDVPEAALETTTSSQPDSSTVKPSGKALRPMPQSQVGKPLAAPATKATLPDRRGDFPLPADDKPPYAPVDPLPVFERFASVKEPFKNASKEFASADTRSYRLDSDDSAKSAAITLAEFAVGGALLLLIVGLMVTVTQGRRKRD